MPLQTMQEWLARDARTPWPYEQQSLINHALEKNPGLTDQGGVCLRLSFKWLACKIYGRPFEFDVKKVNGEKILAKQAVYLKKTAEYEKPTTSAAALRGDPFQPFVANVERVTIEQLNQWGQKNWTPKQGRADTGVKYNLRFSASRLTKLENAPQFRRDAQFIIAIYGPVRQAQRTSDVNQTVLNPAKRAFWAHATTFYRKGNDVFYFDSNGGEFSMGPGDNAGQLIVTDIERYATPGYEIKEFSILEAQQL